jgi:hypothetical protein
MTDFDQLLTRRKVRLGRSEAHELAQKLRARGGEESAVLLEHKLDDAEEITLDRDEAKSLLEELRASGRAWVGGASRASRPAPPPEEPRRGGLSRLWRRR